MKLEAFATLFSSNSPVSWHALFAAIATLVNLRLSHWRGILCGLLLIFSKQSPPRTHRRFRDIRIFEHPSIFQHEFNILFAALHPHVTRAATRGAFSITPCGPIKILAFQQITEKNIFLNTGIQPCLFPWARLLFAQHNRHHCSTQSCRRPPPPHFHLPHHQSHWNSLRPNHFPHLTKSAHQRRPLHLDQSLKAYPFFSHLCAFCTTFLSMIYADDYGLFSSWTLTSLILPLSEQSCQEAIPNGAGVRPSN